MHDLHISYGRDVETETVIWSRLMRHARQQNCRSQTRVSASLNIDEHSEEPVNRDLRGTFIDDMPTVRAFLIPASGVHSDYDMTSENNCYAGSSKCNTFAERGRNGCCENGGRRRFSGTSC